jgi:hypothetical protein
MNSKYNVAYGHTQLMNSPHHRENILDPKFEKFGVGLYISPGGAVWVTEEFLRDDPLPATQSSSTPTDSPGPSVATAP